MLYKILSFSVIRQQESAIGTPCPLPPKPSSHLPPHSTVQAVTAPLFEFPESHGKFPLAIYFTYGILNFYVTLSIISPLPPLHSHVQRSVLQRLFLHCCSENKFISANLLNSIYIYIYISVYNILISFSVFSLCNRL